MLMKFNTGNLGVMNYLKKGKMLNRIAERDELDDRNIITGDYNMVKETISSLEYKDNYYHITLSFKKDIDKEKLDSIVNETRNFIMHGFENDEYEFYAEEHYPKIKDYQYSSSKKDSEKRKQHVHIVIPRWNFLAEKQLKISENLKYDVPYFNSFQEYINCKYELDSPHDNTRDKSINKIDMLKRYKENDLENVSNKDIKDNITQTISNLHKTGEINSIDDVIEYLNSREYIAKKYTRNNKEYNGVRYINSKTQDYISIRLKDDKKNIRLKSKYFDKNFYDQEDQDKYYNKNGERVIKNKTINDFKKDIQEWEEMRERQNKKRYEKNKIKVKGKYKKLFEEITKEFDDLNKDIEIEINSSYLYKLSRLDRIYKENLQELNIESLLLTNEYKVYKDDYYNRFVNNKRNIEIKDHGSKINISKLIKDQNIDKETAVSNMLDIAEAKGWVLDNLKLKGKREYIQEIEKQIEERIRTKSIKIDLEKARNNQKIKQFKNFENKASVKKERDKENKVYLNYSNNKIDISYNDNNIEYSVSRILNEIEDKGWKPENIRIKGSKEFLKEYNSQLEERKEIKQQINYINKNCSPEFVLKTIGKNKEKIDLKFFYNSKNKTYYIKDKKRAQFYKMDKYIENKFGISNKDLVKKLKENNYKKFIGSKKYNDIYKKHIKAKKETNKKATEGFNKMKDKKYIASKKEDIHSFNKKYNPKYLIKHLSNIDDDKKDLMLNNIKETFKSDRLDRYVIKDKKGYYHSTFEYIKRNTELTDREVYMNMKLSVENINKEIDKTKSKEVGKNINKYSIEDINKTYDPEVFLKCLDIGTKDIKNSFYGSKNKKHVIIKKDGNFTTTFKYIQNKLNKNGKDTLRYINNNLNEDLIKKIKKDKSKSIGKDWF